MNSSIRPTDRSWRRHAARTVAGLFLLLQACASGPGLKTASDATEPEAPRSTCGRVDGAVNLALAVFPAVGHAARECKEGDILACNPAVYPIGIMTAVVFAPMGFVIGMMSENAEQTYCARRIVGS